MADRRRRPVRLTEGPPPPAPETRDRPRRQLRTTYGRSRLRFRHVYEIPAPLPEAPQIVHRRRAAPRLYVVSLTRQVLWLASPPQKDAGPRTPDAPTFPAGSPYARPILEPTPRGPLVAPSHCLYPAESPFRRLVVDYLLEGGARVSWELDRNFVDALPHTFQLQSSLSGGLAGADDWANTGPTVRNAYFLVDDSKRQYGVTRDVCYRVLMTTPAGSYTSDPALAHGRLEKRDWLIARNRLRQLRLTHRLASVSGYLLKVRHAGTPCPVCLDPCTGEVQNADCPVCYGTRWSGGYFRAEACTFANTAPISSRPHVTELGTVDPMAVTQGLMLGVLAVAQGDVWVAEGSDRRYHIHPVRGVEEWRGVPVAYSVELRRAKDTDVVYQVPLT